MLFVRRNVPRRICGPPRRSFSTTPCRKQEEDLEKLSRAQYLARSRELLNPKNKISLAYKPKNAPPLPEPEDRITLPPSKEWPAIFGRVGRSERISLSNAEVAAQLAEKFVPAGSMGKTIIEAYPGPGVMTRALLSLPKQRIAKIIILEDYAPYLDWLKPLQEVDPRIVVLPYPGWSWDSYVSLSTEGFLDHVREIPWEGGLHPDLQFISHIPNTVHGEQLAAQLFRGIPERQWLFKYGRVPMNFILSDYLWQRISAGPLNSQRCKLSVIAECCALSRLSDDPATLAPYAANFFPLPAVSSGSTRLEARRVGTPWQAISIHPLEHPMIKQDELDMWDYCLRRLFVLRSSPLKSAITSLAPGAAILLKKINGPDTPDHERVDPQTQIRKLTARDWMIILKAFSAWPFRPTDLHISDSFTPRGEKEL